MMIAMTPRPEDQRGWELRELGEAARRSGDLAAAREHYEDAVAWFRTSPDRLKFAHTVRHLGDVAAEQKDRSQAEFSYVEALHVYRDHPSPPPLDFANAVRAYAVHLSETGRIDEARALWAEAAALYGRAGIEKAVAECDRRAGLDPSQPG